MVITAGELSSYKRRENFINVKKGSLRRDYIARRSIMVGYDCGRVVAGKDRKAGKSKAV